MRARPNGRSSCSTVSELQRALVLLDSPTGLHKPTTSRLGDRDRYRRCSDCCLLRVWVDSIVCAAERIAKTQGDEGEYCGCALVQACSKWSNEYGFERSGPILFRVEFRNSRFNS